MNESAVDYSKLAREASSEGLQALFSEIERVERYNKLDRYRAYAKQAEFHALGKSHPERLLMAANRVGKTFCGATEVAMHLTGRYPSWWVGREFRKANRWWVASETTEMTVAGVQGNLLGRVEDGLGTGAMPKDAIVEYKRSAHGFPGAIQFAIVRHGGGGDVQAGQSYVGFKCFAAGTRVKMADGELREAQDVRLGARVLCADGAARRVTQTHAYADAELLRIATRSGAIDVTPNHRMFTARGEVLAADLDLGDVLEIAAPQIIGDPAEDWRVKLTALMIGDGCTRGKTPFFTCNEPEIVEEVRVCLPATLHLVPITNTISYKIASSEHKHNALRASLISDGLWDKTAHHKFIPQWVFALPRDQKVLFMHWLWGCDGNVTQKDATYVSSSLRLIQDVRLLLWDLGIHADYRSHYTSNQSGKRFLSYYLALHGDNRLRFDAIGKLNRSVTSNITPKPKGSPGEIIAITKLPPAEVYCVGVEDAHELIAEGYRVGNSYDQGREKFQADTLDGVWLDEEPDSAIYFEALTRISTTGGCVFMTFTPLKGPTAVVMRFLIEKPAGTAVVNMTIDDAEHISLEERAKIIARYPAHEREARTKGVPALGSGRVFPVADSTISCQRFKVPDHWFRIGGLDFGWDHPTAGVELAVDRDHDRFFVMRTHRQREVTPVTFAAALRSWGVPWMPWAWPHDGLQHDKGSGTQLAEAYRAQGLNLTAERATFDDGSNGVEAGVQQMLDLMQSGRFFVCDDLAEWFEEMRFYHRQDGKIVKLSDDLLSATRYAFMMQRMAEQPPREVKRVERGRQLNWRTM